MGLLQQGFSALVTPGTNLGGSVNTGYHLKASSGGQRLWFTGEGTFDAVTGQRIATKSSFPPGRDGAWQMAAVSGELLSHFRIAGAAATTANLVGGRAVDAGLVGAGDVDAAMSWIGVLVIAAAGSSSVGASIQGAVPAAAGLTGSGTISSALLTSLINAVAALQGSSDLDADAQAILAAAASLSGAGQVSSAQLRGAISAVAALTGASSVSLVAAAVWSMACDLAGAGVVSDADLRAISVTTAALIGSSELDASAQAKAGMSADISVDTSGILTPSAIADAVWAKIAEGSLSFQDLQRILLAVAAGKTTITPTGSGTADVAFRDLADTKDRVLAEMDGSERVDVVLDPS